MANGLSGLLTGKLKYVGAAVLIILSSSAGLCSDTVKIAPYVDLEKCLGTWYEIARTDHLLERNLEYTSAEFRRNTEGSIILSVTGLNHGTNKWTKAEARVQDKPFRQAGELELLFLGIYTGKYTVLALDDEYRHVLLTSRNSKLVWLLSRDKSIPKGILAEYLRIADANRSTTDDLVWVVQRE